MTIPTAGAISLAPTTSLQKDTHIAQTGLNLLCLNVFFYIKKLKGKDAKT